MTVTVTVFCASSSVIPEHYVELATAVGTQIARRGWRLVTGGGSVSCMGAIAAAARAAGGHTVGVIPEALLTLEVADLEADDLVVTPDMRLRKAEMDERADAFLALPGGLGTLEELLEVWVARTLGLHAKPVVVLDPDGVFAPLRAQVDQLVEQGFARPSVQEAVVWTRTPDEALDAVAAGLARVLPEPPPPTAAEVLEAEP